jgi:hypothetical protein
LPSSAQGRSITLVPDASGGMKAALSDGTTHMEVAKTAVARLVMTLDRPTRLACASMETGHRRQGRLKDTRLLGAFDAVAANGAGIAGRDAASKREAIRRSPARSLWTPTA